jgi:hypothetical protein
VESKVYDRLNSCATPSLDMQESVKIRIMWVTWPGVCSILILAKLLHSVDWPWIIVLAPGWLPVLIFCTLLVCAMWLDQLNE